MIEDSIRYVEVMALLGCTDAEISKAFEGEVLTPELLEHLAHVRAYGASRIPKPSAEAVARERRIDRYRPRWMRFFD